MKFSELRALLEDENEDDRPSISKDGQVDRIKEIGDRYLAGNPFKVGDWVTLRSGCNIKGAGHPNLVIAVRINPEPHWIEATGSQRNGSMDDIRVLCVMSDHVVPFWNESANYEHYTGPGIP